MTASWFSDWFDSPYYHVLYSNRDTQEAEAFMQRLMDYLKVPIESAVLDLPCGKGRHANYLARLGYHVVGADLAPNSIDIARQEAEDKAVFMVHDIRQPAWEEDFDVVVNLFTSLGYFETEADDIAAFSTLARAAKKEGFIVIDFFNSVKVIRDLVPQNIVQRDTVTFELERVVKEGIIYKTIRFQEEQEVKVYQEKVKAFFLNDFIRWAELSNLTLINTFGDYLLNPFDEITSDRLILVFKK